MNRIEKIIDGSDLPPPNITSMKFLDKFATVIEVLHFGSNKYQKNDIIQMFIKLKFDKQVCKLLWTNIGKPYTLIHRTNVDDSWHRPVTPKQLFKFVCDTNSMNIDSLVDAIRLICAVTKAFNIMDCFIDDGELVYYEPDAHYIIDFCPICSLNNNRSNIKLIEHILFNH